MEVIRKKKIDAEAKIFKIISEFEHETSLKVNGLTIEKLPILNGKDFRVVKLNVSL